MDSFNHLGLHLFVKYAQVMISAYSCSLYVIIFYSSSAEQAFRQALFGGRVNESGAALSLKDVQWTQEAIADLQNSINSNVTSSCGRTYLVS